MGQNGVFGFTQLQCESLGLVGYSDVIDEPALECGISDFIFHPEGSVKEQHEEWGVGSGGAGIVTAEKKCWIDADIYCANSFRGALLNLDDLGEVNGGNCSSNVEVDAYLHTEVIRNLSDSFNNECKFKEAIPSYHTVFGEFDALTSVEVILTNIEGDLGGIGDSVECIGGYGPWRDSAFRTLELAGLVNGKFVNCLVKSPVNTVYWVTDELVICLIVVGDDDLIEEIVSVGVDGCGSVGDSHVKSSDVAIDLINWGELDARKFVSKTRFQKAGSLVQEVSSLVT